MTAGTSDALSELARIWRRYEADPEGAIRAVTEAGCRALDVARCSVWLLDEARTVLRCVDLCEIATNRHTSGTELRAADYPAYFRALDDEEPIAADDAHHDPRTAEFSPGYLAPLGIGAMLDAPIRLGLRLVGVVCHEHIGPARVWTRGEQKDAAFLASLTSLALELRQRARREALLSATLESTGEGIVAVDGERVVAFNRRFVEMWKLGEAPGNVSQLRAAMDARTQRLARFLGTASEILADDTDAVDAIELSDGRVFERTSRPQIILGETVGRVWSFRDITGQRRAEAALRASEQRMRELAIRDGLTGLFNRRHTLEVLADALASSARTGEQVTVGLIDLDHFKKVNDTHGHLVGDAVLRDFAQVLGGRLRGTDVVGRYGGEEFIVVMRRADLAAARHVLEAIRADQATRALPEDVPRYTFSAGLAAAGDDGGDVTALLARADERLYDAKRAGRD
ncbi:MAG: diguanylate cyclase, partial [Myxococcales bacterium]|nr:diguanylate cyclase [Myxococcales bacterium]